MTGLKLIKTGIKLGKQSLRQTTRNHQHFEERLLVTQTTLTNRDSEERLLDTRSGCSIFVFVFSPVFV